MLLICWPFQLFFRFLTPFLFLSAYYYSKSFFFFSILLSYAQVFIVARMSLLHMLVCFFFFFAASFLLRRRRTNNLLFLFTARAFSFCCFSFFFLCKVCLLIYDQLALFNTNNPKNLKKRKLSKGELKKQMGEGEDGETVLEINECLSFAFKTRRVLADQANRLSRTPFGFLYHKRTFFFPPSAPSLLPLRMSSSCAYAALRHL